VSTPPPKRQWLPLPFFLSFPGNLLHLLFLPSPSPFFLSFPWESASSFVLAVALAFLSVIPLGICFFFCSCRCPRLSFCHSPWESASSFAFAFVFAFPAVIPSAARNLRLAQSAPVPLHPRTLPSTEARSGEAFASAFALAFAFLVVIPQGSASSFAFRIC